MQTMNIINKITIAVERRGVYPIIDVVQNDVLTRQVEISLTYGGQAWQPPAGVSAAVRFRKPDGKTGLYDTLPDSSSACEIEDNKIIAKLAPEMLTTQGKVEASVALYKDNAVLGTFPFVVMVAPNPAGKKAISNNYYYLQTWDDVNSAIGQLSKLPTNDKSSLVAALIEVNNKIANTGGISDTEKSLILSLFRNAAYTAPNMMADAFAQLEELWGGGDEPDEPDVPDEPDEPVGTIYTITAELVNVTSSNRASSVTEGASYSTTLTANDGYEISSVTVFMGGVDVTADVYADGVISIPAVTGNVEIVASATESEVKEPELITDGLVDYFDFRTAEYDNSGATTGGATIVNSSIGDGWLYAWANNVVTEQNAKYGIKKTNRMLLYSNESKTEQSGLGNAFTWVFKCRMDTDGSPFSSGDYSTFSNLYLLSWTPKYNNAGGTAQDKTVLLTTDKAKAGSYQCIIITVDGSICRLYHNGELLAQNDGSAIDGFVSWYDKLGATNLTEGQYLSQLAVYNRALTDIEITETVAYLESLEVA